MHAADLPHGEDPTLNLPVHTAGWQPVKIHEDWKGSRLEYDVRLQGQGTVRGISNHNKFCIVEATLPSS
jgi:hypothetical protein